MIHIHYQEGPELLRDVSIEQSDEVIRLLREGFDISEVCRETGLLEEAVLEIRRICNSKLRRCCFCGALFDPKGTKRKQCYKPEHFLPCIDCGKPTKVIDSYAMYQKTDGKRCYSCRNKKIGETRKNRSPEEKAATVAKQQATMIERYGAATPLQVPELKVKIQNTVKEKYGVDNLSQSAEIQDRIRQNSLEKYGVDHYSKDPAIRQRMIDGMVKKYGVTSALKSEKIREALKQTNLERYGVENVFQNEQVRQTFADNHMKKYGVAWPHQRPDLIEKVKESNKSKYGAAMYPISDEYMRTVISDPEKFENYKSFMEDPEAYINRNYTTKPSVFQICKDIGVTDTTVYDKLIAVGKRDLATEYSYSMENELIEFLVSLKPDIRIDKHNRKILHRKEIDIYLPDYSIGFECNPTCTHNSSFVDPWGCPPKDYKYHFNKSKAAREEGVFLFHIFGYEWHSRKDVILSQVQNLLGLNSRKVYGRKTKVVELTPKEAAEFLDENHRQGSSQSKVRLGLIDSDSDELVSVMTFGKMRPGIGKKSNQTETEWELIRFCNLRETSVVGGASKLFKHFLETYNPTKVVSFSDVAHTRGNLYETLGFKYVSLSDPGYVWVNMIDDSYLTRVSCQKSNLPNLFEDVTTETIKSHTEAEIMMSHGYARVYDSGVIRWEYCP